MRHTAGDSRKSAPHTHNREILRESSFRLSLSPSLCLSAKGFCRCRALSTNFNDEPHKASRPFDKNRDGFVIGEGKVTYTNTMAASSQFVSLRARSGAGILLLEEYSHALKRFGSAVYGGGGFSLDYQTYGKPFCVIEVLKSTPKSLATASQVQSAVSLSFRDFETSHSPFCQEEPRTRTSHVKTRTFR